MSTFFQNFHFGHSFERLGIWICVHLFNECPEPWQTSPRQCQMQILLLSSSSIYAHPQGANSLKVYQNLITSSPFFVFFTQFFFLPCKNTFMDHYDGIQNCDSLKYNHLNFLINFDSLFFMGIKTQGKKGLQQGLGPFHLVWYTLKDFHSITQKAISFQFSLH